MKAYLISLNNPVEKIDYLKSFDIETILVKGINGNQLSDKDIDKNTVSLYNIFGPKSAIGCAMSHINTWKEFLNTDENFAIIFEDDVVLEDNFQYNLRKVLDNVPDDFDILYLGCFGCDIDQKINIFNLVSVLLGMSSQSQSYRINKYISIPRQAYATHSYILSRKGAMTLLNYINKKIYNHVDIMIQSLYSKEIIKIYVSTPRLAYQTSTDSGSSENISSNHPLIVSKFLNNFYVDKMVRANYMSSVSFARLYNININIMSILFIILGIIFGLHKVSILYSTIFYLLLSFPDIFFVKKTNDIKIIILNYLFFIIPIFLIKNIRY